MLSLEKAFLGRAPAVLPTLWHPPTAPGAKLSCEGAGVEALLWAQWLGRESGCCPGGLPWGVGHAWTPTWLMLCPLLPGTAWPSASSTAAPASWLALPSSPSWASWRRSRACPSPRWPSRVSGAVVGRGCGVAARGACPRDTHPGTDDVAAAGAHPGGQLCFLPPKTREKQRDTHEMFGRDGRRWRSV